MLKDNTGDTGELIRASVDKTHLRTLNMLCLK